jgi:broad specificity phosphatase PhoE
MDFVHHPAPEGMEPLSSVVDRAGRFLEEIREQGGNILISTHAIAMKGILEYLTPSSHGAYWSRHIGNCAVYVAENENGIIGVPKEKAQPFSSSECHRKQNTGNGNSC